jgi:hypothetical protein
MSAGAVSAVDYRGSTAALSRPANNMPTLSMRASNHANRPTCELKTKHQQAAFGERIFKKTVMLLSTGTIFGVAGFVVPLMSDREVGGALTSALLRIGGLIIGGLVGAIIVERAFDLHVPPLH